MKNHILAFFCFLALASCEKKSELILKVSPEAFNINLFPGDSVLFTVSASSEVGLTKFYIIQNNASSGDIVLFDSTLNGRSFSSTYKYFVPVSASGVYSLLFKVIDEESAEFSNLKRLNIVTNSTNPLIEITNNILYSAYNQGFNGFDLDSLKNVYYDSTSIEAPDLFEFDDDTVGTSSSLTYRWKSPSGGSFVKAASSIIFSTSTRQSLINLFDGTSQITATTDSLVVGDVYGFKSAGSTPKYFLLRLDSIVPDVDFSRYEFTVRK